MPDIRADYPFQINYYDSRLDRCLVVLRAETANELGEAYVQLLAVLDGALGLPDESEQAAAPEPSASPQPSDSVAELPVEALKALMEQKKQEPCSCNAGWWDNRQSKKTPKYPDFKCKKCTKGVWLTAFQEGQ